ncbi:hypothetical protein V6N12_060079 [Hibiscus sabdariffa]|uniref:Uncharacterized protein n=1 Tax=Hibiscus sabdariffa TaxID=183260 RepID=A0ABR2D3F4_9ROSI
MFSNASAFAFETTVLAAMLKEALLLFAKADQTQTMSVLHGLTCYAHYITSTDFFSVDFPCWVKHNAQAFEISKYGYTEVGN